MAGSWLSRIWGSAGRLLGNTIRLVREYPFQAAALLIAFAAAWPLISEPGLLNSTRGGGDSPFLLQRLQQVETALRDGHFPVRWMPDANYGFGYPFYNYYAPLSFYIAAIFRFIGFSYVRSIQLAQLLASVTAALGMFYLGRRWLRSDWAGFLAAAAYTLAPFHMVNVYVRGDSLAEFWAMAFYPLVLLSADRLFDAGPAVGSGRKAGLFALSYAGLILSHNISALIFSPFLLLYLLLRWWRASGDQRPAASRPRALGLILPAAALLLALGLAAHFFIPALAEKGLAQLEPATAGHFYYGNHFRGWDLAQTSLLFNYDPAGGRAFRMGLVQAVLGVAGGIVLLVTTMRWRTIKNLGNGSGEKIVTWSPGLLFILATLLIATFMTTPLSRPLWDNVPLLPFVQFPWRFLSVQAIGVALITSALALLPGRRFIVPFVVLLLLVSSLGQLETAYLYLTDADVTAEKLAQYEWFTGNIGSTVSAEYLPNTVQPRAYTSSWLISGERTHVQLLAGQLLASELIDRRATRQTWRLDVGAGADSPLATLSFPTMFWPGWRLTVDGEAAEARPGPGFGLITLDLSPGSHLVELRLGPTPVRLAAELVSLVAALVVLWQFGLSAWRPVRMHLYLALGLALLAVGLRLWPERPLADGDLNWDFAQMGYLHHTPGGIVFDNGIVLEEYTYSHDEIDAGETLSIKLTWAGRPAGPPPKVTLALALPAINRFSDAPLIASETALWQAGSTTYQFSLPENTPGVLYAPRLTLDEGRAVMSANRLRGDLFLRPIRVRGTLPQAEGVASLLAAKAIRVRQRDGQTLEVQLAWLTQKPLGPNYNVTLRLIDADGMLLTQFDTQPGYGFSPSSSWPPGRWVDDWLTLALPQPLPQNGPYKLLAQLYDVHSGEVALMRFLGDLERQGDELVFHAPQHVYTLPEGIVPLTAVFSAESGPIIQLRGYESAQTNDRLRLTLYWQALTPGQVDYTRFVHLAGPTPDQPPLVQDDAMPRNNSYPTGQWVAGEVVSETVTLDVSSLPAGEYQVMVGLYRNLGHSFPRLRVTGLDGEPYPDGRVPLPIPVIRD